MEKEKKPNQWKSRLRRILHSGPVYWLGILIFLAIATVIITHLPDLDQYLTDHGYGIISDLALLLCIAGVGVYIVYTYAKKKRYVWSVIYAVMFGITVGFLLKGLL